MVVSGNFSKLDGTVPLKNKNAQIMRESVENILINSKRKSILIETDQGKEFNNNIFQNLFENIIIKHCSRNTSLGAVFCRNIQNNYYRSS